MWDTRASMGGRLVAAGIGGLLGYGLGALFEGGAEATTTSGAITDDEIEAARGALAKLASAAKPQVLTAIDAADDAAGRAIRDTVTQAPKFILDSVLDSAIGAAEKLSDTGAKSKLDAMRLQYRRENIAEVQQGLAAVSQLLQSAPAVRELTNKALSVLENQGFLGRSLITNLVGVLTSVAAGATLFRKQLSATDIRFGTNDANISLNLQGKYNANLKAPNPLWRRQAVAVAFEGSGPALTHTQKGQTVFGPGASPAKPQVQRFEVSAPVVISKGGRTTGPVSVSPYYSTTLATKEQQAGVRAGFKF